MVIAGGFYRETCESPQWDRFFGSGGRAAAAISDLADSVELYTYCSPAEADNLDVIEVMGVRIRTASRDNGVVFAYFHPLSKPFIAPEHKDICIQAPLKVEGSVVLRFGFLEGDAIVRAERAVYDPQCAAEGWRFSANGSTAEVLAIVLNEGELCASMKCWDVDLAAHRVIARDGAALVLVKSGPKGVRLYQSDGETHWIPAYESPRVFKIGSGDVFSAAFAYYWGEANKGAVEAADLASRSVSYYCGTATLPLPRAKRLRDLKAVGSIASSPVLLIGSDRTLGGRWMLEETRYCLSEMGVDVVSSPREGEAGIAFTVDNCGAVLVLGDYTDKNSKHAAKIAIGSGRPIVALNESERVAPDFKGRSNVTVTDDFATAVYFASWAAAV